MSNSNHQSISGFGRKMITSLQSPDYRIFFYTSVAQCGALTVQTMVGPLLMYRLTGSSALLGINSLMSAIPSIVIGLFGGALADRLPKKRIILVCFILEALIFTMIGTLLKTGLLSREAEGSWMILMAANFVQNCVMSFLMPALMSILPETIERDQLMNAIALNNLQMSILGFIIPSLAGIVIDQFGFESAYYSISGCYGLAAILISFLPLRSPAAVPREQILSNISNGFRYIRGNSTVMYLLLITLAMILLSVPYQSLLPVFTDTIFNVGATGLGLLVSICGAGGLAGSLAMAMLPNRKRGLILIASGLLSGLSLVFFSLSSVWGLALVMMAFTGLAASFRANLANALMQTYTDAAYMGRVMSLTYVQFGIMSTCTFLAGLTAEHIPVQWVIGSMAGLLTLIMIAVLIGNRKIRVLD